MPPQLHSIAPRLSRLRCPLSSSSSPSPRQLSPYPLPPVCSRCLAEASRAKALFKLRITRTKRIFPPYPTPACHLSPSMKSMTSMVEENTGSPQTRRAGSVLSLSKGDRLFLLMGRLSFARGKVESGFVGSQRCGGVFSPPRPHRPGVHGHRGSPRRGHLRVGGDRWPSRGRGLKHRDYATSHATIRRCLRENSIPAQSTGTPSARYRSA